MSVNSPVSRSHNSTISSKSNPSSYPLSNALLVTTIYKQALENDNSMGLKNSQQPGGMVRPMITKYLMHVITVISLEEKTKCLVTNTAIKMYSWQCTAASTNPQETMCDSKNSTMVKAFLIYTNLIIILKLLIGTIFWRFVSSVTCPSCKREYPSSVSLSHAMLHGFFKLNGSIGDGQWQLDKGVDVSNASYQTFVIQWYLT